MQLTSPQTTLSIPLTGIKEGHRYSVLVTGATGNVTLELQHVKGGAWIAQPGYVPAAGTVLIEFPCIVPRMRVNVAGGQAGPWTATWVKQTQDVF